jgi:hypothetical protein
MKNRFKYSCIFLMLFFASCVDSTTESSVTGTSEIEDTLIDFDIQKYIIPAIRDTVVTGEKGTIIKLSSNNFHNSEGSIYAGNIEVQLIEFYKLSEMVVNNLTTETNKGELLSTGGMVYINFLDSNNRQLTLANGKSYELWFKKEDTTDKREMHLFKGEWNKEDTPCLKWDKTDNPLVQETLLIDSSNWFSKDSVIFQNLTDGIEMINYFIFSSTTFGWVNCDSYALLNSSEKEKFTSIKILSNSNDINVVYRLINKKEKSIGAGLQQKEGYHKFEMVRPGEEYTIFSFYKQDGNYYSYLKNFIPGKNENEITPKYEKIDQAGLKIQAERLDD